MEKGLLALERAQATGEVQREEEPESALAYLQDIYKGRRPADHTRMRAAKECLPFETPRLQVTGYMRDDATFAQALDRAIARSQAGRVTLELTANGGAGEGAADGAGAGEAG
jgi:hypothetical protein